MRTLLVPAYPDPSHPIHAALTLPARTPRTHLSAYEDLLAAGAALDLAFAAADEAGRDVLIEVGDVVGVNPECGGFVAGLRAVALAWRHTHDGLNFIPNYSQSDDPLDGACRAAEAYIDGHALEELHHLADALAAVTAPMHASAFKVAA